MQDIVKLDEDSLELYFDDNRLLYECTFEIDAEALDEEDSKERAYKIKNAIVNAYEIAEKIQGYFEKQ